MAIGVGIVAKSDIVVVLELDEVGHGVGRRTVHAYLAVVIHRHKAEGGIDRLVYDGYVEAIKRLIGSQYASWSRPEGRRQCVSPPSESTPYRRLL